MMKYLEITW